MSNITNTEPDVNLPDAYDMTVGTVSVGHYPPMPRLPRLSNPHADREGGPLDTYLFLTPTDESFRQQALEYLEDHLNETTFKVKPAGGTYYSPNMRHWDWVSPDDADEDDHMTRFRSVMVQEPAGSNTKVLTEHTYTLSVVAKPMAEDAVTVRDTLGRGASHLTIPWDEEAAPDEDSPPILEAVTWDGTADIKTGTLDIESNHVPLTRAYGKKWEYEASWSFPVMGDQEGGGVPLLSKTGSPDEQQFMADVEAFVDCRVYTSPWTAQSDSEIDTEEDYEVGEELLVAERRAALSKASKSNPSTQMVLRSSKVGSSPSHNSEDPLEAESGKFLSMAGRASSGGPKMTLRRRATTNDNISTRGEGLLAPEAHASGSARPMTLRSGATVGGDISREEQLPHKRKRGKKDRVNTFS